MGVSKFQIIVLSTIEMVTVVSAIRVTNYMKNEDAQNQMNINVQQI